MLVGSVIVPEVQKVSGHVDRKTCAVGITLILTQCPTMLLPTHFDTWSMLLVALVKLFELPEEDANEEENEEEAFANAGLAVDEFQVAYNQLVFANQYEVDPVAHVPDARLFLPKALATFAQANPGKIGPVLAALPDDVKVVLANYFTRAQVDINSIK
jgi:exportin-2 (importin alpha re-exporter)